MNLNFNRWIGILVLMAGATLQARAQSVRIVDSLYFRTETSEDIPIYRAFGVGDMYVDGADNNHTVDFEVFSFPPDQFYALFLRQCDDGGAECYYQGDLRHTPDSAKQTESGQFSIDYKIGFQLYTGKRIIIDVVRPLVRGIDSIHFQDLLTGTLYNHTFTGGVAEDTIKVNGVTQLKMTVYYSLAHYNSGVDEPQEMTASLGLYPNPVRAGTRMNIAGSQTARARVTLHDALGKSLEMTGDAISGYLVPDVAPGLYVVTMVGPHGEIVGREKIVVSP